MEFTGINVGGEHYDSIETLLIDCFIALMLFILWAGTCAGIACLNRLREQIEVADSKDGLFHSWQMFSPDRNLIYYAFVLLRLGRWFYRHHRA